MKQKHDDMKNKIIIVLPEDERSYGNQQTGNFRVINRETKSVILCEAGRNS